MLRHYLRIAIAVLLRHKFLTFVNIFGAALTLTVLVVAFSIVQSFVSPSGAQHRQNHILSISRVAVPLRRGHLTFVNGPSYRFFKDYVKPLKTPDNVSSTELSYVPMISYVSGRRLSLQLRWTDAAYWKILDFDVLEGRVIELDDVDQGRLVGVINRSTANKYFPGESAIGKTITEKQVSYVVVGVVADEPETSRLAYADIWVPITNTEMQAVSWVAEGEAILYVDDPSKRAAVQTEFQDLLGGFVDRDQPDMYAQAFSAAWTPLERLASYYVGDSGEDTSFDYATNRVPQMMTLAAIVVLLFMLLPAINATNINIGRTLERTPEIGLRKATGASRKDLALQIIIENVLLATLGGIVAFAFAPLVLIFLNETLFVHGRLTLDMTVFLASFVCVLVFGVLSGAYPAWKIANLNPATALRGTPHA